MMDLKRPELATEALDISEISDNAQPMIERVKRHASRIVIEDAGAPVAMVVSIADWERLKRHDQAWDERTRELEQFSAAFSHIPIEELEAQVDETVAKIRAEDRRERLTARRDRRQGDG